MLSIVATVMFLAVIAMLWIGMASVPAPITSATRTTSASSAAPVVAAPTAAAVPVEEKTKFDTMLDEYRCVFEVEESCQDMAALYIEMNRYFGIVHEVVYSPKRRKIIEADDDITIGHLVVPFARSYQWQVSTDGGRNWASADMEDNNTSCVVINQNVVGIYRCIVHTDRCVFIGNELEIR